MAGGGGKRSRSRRSRTPEERREYVRGISTRGASDTGTTLADGPAAFATSTAEGTAAESGPEKVLTPQAAPLDGEPANRITWRALLGWFGAFIVVIVIPFAVYVHGLGKDVAVNAERTRNAAESQQRDTNRIDSAIDKLERRLNDLIDRIGGALGSRATGDEASPKQKPAGKP